MVVARGLCCSFARASVCICDFDRAEQIYDFPGLHSFSVSGARCCCFHSFHSDAVSDIFEMPRVLTFIDFPCIAQSLGLAEKNDVICRYAQAHLDSREFFYAWFANFLFFKSSWHDLSVLLSFELVCVCACAMWLITLDSLNLFSFAVLKFVSKEEPNK